jgi:hypothetical protein
MRFYLTRYRGSGLRVIHCQQQCNSNSNSNSHLPRDISILFATPVEGAMFDEVPMVKPLPSGTPRIVMVRERFFSRSLLCYLCYV